MGLLLPLLLAASISVQGSNGVPERLLSKLETGVNVTRWFCYLGSPLDPAHLKSYLNDQDFANFKRLSVGFVRLCISPEAIYDDGGLNSTTLPYLDAALTRFEKAGIAVIWDLHDNGQLKLDQPGHDNSEFVRFWEATAKHYKGKQEDQLVFEILNEPVFMKNPAVWYALQKETVAAIRKADPKRTIMATSTSWSNIDTFVKMEPLAESNLVYTFHCYDPFIFTHQGASWVGDFPKLLKHIPFPSSPEAVSAILDEEPEPLRASVVDYGKQRFGADALKARIQAASDWGKVHHVPVVLGEFGAYPLVSPVESRGRWFEAMRRAVDDLKMPNAIWGYDDALGLGRTTEGGSVKLDPVSLKSFYRKG
ncbi:MAG TPA: cellulase family glycosylhydrolase [Fimbriimonadaceae bacterium]|nr:cellulase family glycosylhydrolase [Fimbriimonadaceae bacterium]